MYVTKLLEARQRNTRKELAKQALELTPGWQFRGFSPARMKEGS